MTHRESKAISDRINRKAEKSDEMRKLSDKYSLESLITLHEAFKDAAAENSRQAAYFSKAIRKRKMEAKKLTGSGDERRTRIAAGPEISGHVEASPAVDGVRVDGSDGRRRSSNRT